MMNKTVSIMDDVYGANKCFYEKEKKEPAKSISKFFLDADRLLAEYNRKQAAKIKMRQALRNKNNKLERSRVICPGSKDN